uniref:Uncharacterized protein n=1 Tax=Anguilla anguilla TaxID=7936 RepID=A0A0E9W567_ANGAN
MIKQHKTWNQSTRNTQKCIFMKTDYKHIQAGRLKRAAHALLKIWPKLGSSTHLQKTAQTLRCVFIATRNWRGGNRRMTQRKSTNRTPLCARSSC